MALRVVVWAAWVEWEAWTSKSGLSIVRIKTLGAFGPRGFFVFWAWDVRGERLVCVPGTASSIHI
jgi:hypothetical protein